MAGGTLSRLIGSGHCWARGHSASSPTFFSPRDLKGSIGHRGTFPAQEIPWALPTRTLPFTSCVASSEL